MDKTTEFTDAQDILGPYMEETSTETCTTPSMVQVLGSAPADASESQTALPSALGKQGPAQPKAATKKKSRELPREQAGDFAEEMVDWAGILESPTPGGSVPDDHNITTPLVKKAVQPAPSEHSLSEDKFDYSSSGSGKDHNEFNIEDRGMILDGNHNEPVSKEVAISTRSEACTSTKAAATNLYHYGKAIRMFYRDMLYKFAIHMVSSKGDPVFDLAGSRHYHGDFYKIDDLNRMFHEFIETNYSGESGIVYDGVKMVE